MTLFRFMYEKLKARMDSGTIYPCFVFFADTHYRVDKTGWDNSGFFQVLDRAALEKPLFILIGGDLIDNGKKENYQAFVTVCTNYTNTTGIPIIPVIGNHHYYQVLNPLDEYHKYIGAGNFRLEVTGGLADRLTVVAFNDARPERPGIIVSIPDMKDQTCSKVWKKSDKHIFEFTPKYINEDSHFINNLNSSQGNHIIIAMHVPPRLTPLPEIMDAKIQAEYPYCIGMTQMKKLLKYYKDLWTLVHGNSTSDRNDSTKWFVDSIKNRNQVEMVLTGHIHTYFAFTRNEGHPISYVISGGGGNNNQVGGLAGFPVTKRHYIRIFFNASSKRFDYQKVDAGN